MKKYCKYEETCFMPKSIQYVVLYYKETGPIFCTLVSHCCATYRIFSLFSFNCSFQCMPNWNNSNTLKYMVFPYCSLTSLLIILGLDNDSLCI